MVSTQAAGGKRRSRAPALVAGAWSVDWSGSLCILSRMQTFTDLYRYRFILANLVAKNLKVLYRNMALGFLWSILNPLVMLGVLSLVFIGFMRAEPTFPAMFFVGLVPFNFFSYCANSCTVSIVNNVSLVKKVAFPRQIIPVSVIATHLIDFAAQAALLVLLLFIIPPPGRVFGWQLLWLAPIFAVHLALCVGFGFLVAALNVRYRDVQYIVGSLLTVLFWASPILYEPWETLAGWPVAIRIAYYLNPMAGIVQAYRAVLYHGMSPEPVIFAASFLVTLLIGVAGVRTFWLQEKSFADLI